MGEEEAVHTHARFGFDDLKRILVDEVGIDEDHIGDDRSARFEEMGLDSLAFIQLQTVLEEEYGIRIRDEDAERIYTMDEAVDYINERLAEKEPAQHD